MPHAELGAVRLAQGCSLARRAAAAVTIEPPCGCVLVVSADLMSPPRRNTSMLLAAADCAGQVWQEVSGDGSRWELSGGSSGSKAVRPPA
jgi:hypothetical protein